MASFIGTRKEFKRFIGPRLRNLVNIRTKAYRVGIANCNHCGAKERLESAHVKGRERNQIIDALLNQFTHNDVITIDLAIFERLFLAEHDPIEKTILILCRECHSRYDATVVSVVPAGTTDILADRQYSHSVGQLTIALVPHDPTTFKNQLLRTHRARIIRSYLNGREEVRLWNASNFTQSSNVLGNLRSRPEFRQGRWQELGIAKVTVEVVE